MEIEDEVKEFTARSSRQPTDEEFLELENTVRELRAKYCRNEGGCNGSVASSDSRGKGTTRGSNNSSRRVSEKVLQSRDADRNRDEDLKSRHHGSGEGDREREGGKCGGDDKGSADAAGQVSQRTCRAQLHRRRRRRRRRHPVGDGQGRVGQTPLDCHLTASQKCAA